ncbi:diacylglycerol kinase family protein [Balneolaceae bacterium ANBcel3]|nr:diacylglycerol kinase family protein [Balneolaceae bacterium ANBcel3]
MLLVVYNTSAGKGNVKKMIKRLGNSLVNQGTPCTFIDINRFTKDTAGELMQHGTVKRVIICGGDGTVNRVVNMLSGFLNTIEIGIIPYGYGNLFAKSVPSSTSIDRFVSEKKACPFSEVKIGKANNQYFLNVASVGIIADTVDQVEQFRNVSFGSFFYRVFGGFITHVMLFCVTKIKTLFSRRGKDQPDSITWLRSTNGSPENSFTVLFDLRSALAEYNSLFMPRLKLIPWGKKEQAHPAGDYHIKHEDPFTWQVDGVPKEKTTSLKVDINSQTVKIVTIDQELF